MASESKALFADTNELCWPVCRDLERRWDMLGQQLQY